MTTTTLPADARPSTRLAAVRRLYVYAVLLISFSVGLAAVDGLLAALADVWLASSALPAVNDGSFQREALARSGGALLIAALLFLIHWAIARRQTVNAGAADDGLAERESFSRKLFLYGASAVSLGYVLARGYDFLRGLGRLGLGEATAQLEFFLPSGWLNLSLIALIGLGLLIFWQRTLRDDGDYGRERDWPGAVRRLYQTIAGLVAIALTLTGSARLFETLLNGLLGFPPLTTSLGNNPGLSRRIFEVADSSWWAAPVADGLALLLLGLVLLRALTEGWRELIDARPVEAQAALRRVYLYLAVASGALATLIPLSLALNELLLLLFNVGSAEGGRLLGERLEQFVTPASFIPAGLILWVGYRRYLHGETARYGDTLESATVRRIYNYIVAAAGLALLWVGIVFVLQAGLDRLVFVRGNEFWLNPLAGGLSALLIGAPIWSLHWRTVQQRARRDDLAGARERDAWPRKIYLYGVALVGALLILLDVAQVLYRLLLFLLGEPNAELFAPETAESLARSGVALIIWGAHVLELRRDARLGTNLVDEADEVAAREKRRTALAARIEELEEELVEAQTALANLEAGDESDVVT